MNINFSISVNIDANANLKYQRHSKSAATANGEATFDTVCGHDGRWGIEVCRNRFTNVNIDVSMCLMVNVRASQRHGKYDAAGQRHRLLSETQAINAIVRNGRKGALVS